MKIAICGTRGIPNNYGGFEQCAEMLAVLLAEAGHDVTVYNPTHHPYADSYYKGVKIVKQWNPEKSAGTVGNFIYDYKCMQNAVYNNSDILLMLGYTTSSVFFPWMRRGKSILITNMDGLEWKRNKWNAVVKKLAKWFESLGARYSDYLVSDNREIRNYLLKEYKKDSVFIAYGADVFNDADENILSTYNCSKRNYDLLIARFEKENNIETILDGVVEAQSHVPFLVIGNHNTPYGEHLKAKYKSYGSIRFTGGIYNLSHLNNLRYYSRFYFHGHSVGGTNPSLLEAMASHALILAHDNPFNRDVIASNAFFFKDAAEVSTHLKLADQLLQQRVQFVEANLSLISNQYNWKKIAAEYEQLFKVVKS